VNENLTIDLEAAPREIQRQMNEGHAVDELVMFGDLIGLDVHVYLVQEFDDEMIVGFKHRTSGFTWLAKFSGFDAELVEVFAKFSEFTDGN
jgi:hypothetical protein